jgi:hypothetical protein
MKSIRRILVVPFLAAALFLPVAASAQPTIPGCTTGVLPSGALSLICVPPAGWNGELVVFAHGWVPFNQPLGFYHLALPDGTLIPAVRYGHCNFTANEVLTAFGLAVRQP